MINEIISQLALEDKENPHEKTSFWASDSERMLFDVFHTWMGTEPTNPIGAQTRLIFNAGKMMELAIVEVMERAKMAEVKEEQLRIEMERRGVPVSGYVDAVLNDGTPVEIKSFYGYYQVKDLEAGKPKTSYLKQLAIYMDCLGANLGKLLYVDRGTGQMYEFDLIRQDGLTFQCNDIQFNLDDTYKKWEIFYRDHVLTKTEPPIEHRYKIPVKEVNWKAMKSSDITKARTNKRVVGDHPWAIQYSSYKDLIIERQGETQGYTSDELVQIKQLTAGFSRWS